MSRRPPSALILVAAVAAAITIGIRHHRERVMPAAAPSWQKNEPRSGAMAALDLWATSRAYPGKVIPDIGHAAAFEYSRANLAAGPADQSSETEWTPIGPHNIGGRTLAVVQNPENPATLWAGAASGGLWRSFTAGVGPDAWDPVDTGFPVLGVSSIAIAPDDSNHIFIGTGEVYGYQSATGGLAIRLTRGSYGIGILESTDGGATWTRSLDWSYAQQRGVASLAMHPGNPDILYAGTTEGTLKTTDGGDSWTQVHPVLMSMQVVIDPAEPNRVYAACGDLGSPDTGIYRSTDDGASWTELTSGLPEEWNGKAWLTIYRSSPNVIYASIANAESGIGLFYSIDYGDSWVQLSDVNFAVYQGWYSHCVHVNPHDSTQVVAAGVQIWRSSEGGRELQQVSYSDRAYTGVVLPGEPEGPSSYSHADHHAVIFDPERPDTLYFATDGGVFVSTNDGKTFGGRNGGYQTSQFYNGFTSADYDPDLAIGGLQDSWTNLYMGTVAWDRKLIGGDGAWTALHPTSPETLFGSSQYLRIQRSIDGGETFEPATHGMGSGTEVAFIAPYVLSPAVPTVMYAGRTKIFRSTDAAENWEATNGNEALDENPALSMAISASSPQVVYVATAPVHVRAGVFVTTDGGDTWTNVTGNLPDRYPVDLAVDPTDDSIAYLVMSGFGSGHLFRTDDRGVTWSDLTGNLPDVPSSAIAIDPDYTEILYLGNDLGAYVSTDNGSTWEEFRTGMPGTAIIMDLSIVRATRRIRAATHGYGVFERDLLDPQVAVAEGSRAPAARLEVLAATPNPFRDATTLRFRLGESTPVAVRLYDVSGRMVATLIAGEARERGEHAVRIDARSLGLAPGMYLGRVEAFGETATQRLVLIR